MMSKFTETRFGFAAESFEPTPASIPPVKQIFRLRTPPGLPVNLHPLNPLLFLLRCAQICPQKLALAHPDVEYPVFYSYAVWAQRIQNLAYALIMSGIQPGDRVAVIAPNSPLIADAHHGVLAARGVLTPINTRLTKHEVSYILQHSGAKIILVDHEYVHLVSDANARCIVSMDTGRVSDPYEDFLNEGRTFSAEKGWSGLDMELNEDSAATLCYTSGTTGRVNVLTVTIYPSDEDYWQPKGVLSTLRGSYLASIGNAFEARLDRNAVYLWILPMFHAAGWTFPWAITFAFASQITMRTVSNSLIWSHFKNFGVSHYCAAPTVQIGIINDPDAVRLPSPIMAIIAGSAPTAHLIGELEKKNILAVHVYGLTFTYGPFTRAYAQPSWEMLSLEERAKLMARQGHSFATAQEVRVVSFGDNDELIDVPADGKTVGEIVTRGNIVMKEYFRDERATQKAFRGGYFGSGDLAVMYPDGAIAIQDRSKDIIISGGENASSLAIEQELSTHPDILEVAVVARPHPRWGERPMAFVVLRPEKVRQWNKADNDFSESLKVFSRGRLPGFACPEWVQVVDELPKTSTGKILKTTLRGIVAKL
ncbi:acetyl-CoA synthetase-like protein [Rickenella mellea]|uniref:Acetyl-CoA synthetase-like protein n=1 Tax=Rickenella mellea TaxID=50990 RepID=A0A4Y7QL71_9AGAM|nr:acetyl-CoA synthetase-like protein [Rickenella mellea]